jgi:DNA-binding HxlR family transcriptional regulator
MIRVPHCSCPKAQALFILLGKKWTIFIMQAVDAGADTFTQIREDIGGANTKIVTDRLAELVESGILLKDKKTGHYTLSSLGKELSNKLIELSHWWGTASAEKKEKKKK